MYDAKRVWRTKSAEDVSTFFQKGPLAQSHFQRSAGFSTRIRRNVRLAEAPSFANRSCNMLRRPTAREDYRQFAGEVLAMAATREHTAGRRKAALMFVRGTE